MKRKSTARAGNKQKQIPVKTKSPAFFPSAHKGQGKKPNRAEKKKKSTSTQAAIPYKAMYRDGICHTNDGRFSKTVRFYDINYQLAQSEDKASIFENWCDFLNYFD